MALEQTVGLGALFCRGFGGGFRSCPRWRCRFELLFGFPSRMSFFECFALRFEFSQRGGLRLSLRRDARVDHSPELHFLLGARARGCFDIRFSTCALSQNARAFNFGTGSRLRCGERFPLGPHTSKRRCGHRALGLDAGLFPRFSPAIGLRLLARSRPSNSIRPGKG